MKLPAFTFYVHKPKARALAAMFAKGCALRGYTCEVTEDATPRPGRVGVFYGVVHQTYPAFRFHMASKTALYLDNGWLSSPERPTFRFAWNGAQAALYDMPRDPEGAALVPPLPTIERAPEPGRAMLVLQTDHYFEFMRLGYTRAQWESLTTRMLKGKGYVVHRREKPKTKMPGVSSFFDEIARAEIVVSLNSASTVKALRYGIPAFCTLDCTPSPLAPPRVPVRGRAVPPDPDKVADMMSLMAGYEVTPSQFKTGEAAARMLRVPEQHRRGYWYATV